MTARTSKKVKEAPPVASDIDFSTYNNKRLVIVESPAKAKTIGKYLGNDFRVRATVGHVRDLPEKGLGIDIENGFTPKYVPVPGKEKVLDELKGAAKVASHIYLATDPDREGEAIAWHVAESIKQKNGAPVQRVLFHEITKEAVQAAIKKAGRIDDKKVNAQQARRVLDRLVGYKASPLLWKTVKKGLSAGRVQTVALRLIVEREREIRAFKPVEYWTVDALLEKNGQKFTAKLHQLDGKKPEIHDGATANAILADLKGRKHFQVTEVRKRERRKNPSAPFTTSTLQQEGAKKLSFGSRKTMRVAQDLYEGIELGKEEGQVGLITYMRTDSTRVSPAAADQARDVPGGAVRRGLARGRTAALRQGGRQYAGRARSRAPDRADAPSRGREEIPLAGTVQALRADLEAVHGEPDGARRVRHHHGGLRPRPLPVPLHRQRHQVRRIPRALSRGARGRGRTRARGRAGAPGARSEGERAGARDHAARSTSPSRRRASRRRVS